MRSLYLHNRADTKLFFDFKQLNIQCKRIIERFKRFGFKLIAFIDGYYCNDKFKEKRQRRYKTLTRIRKNIKLIKQMHQVNNNENIDNDYKVKHRKAIMKKMEFVPSSGYTHFIEQSLKANGVIVYRGSGKHDIDKDIAQFVVDHGDKIYAILSIDTDFFGFNNLPKHIKLITKFRVKTECKPKTQSQRQREIDKQTLTFTYFLPYQLWEELGLNTYHQRLQLICLCGNDFIKKEVDKQY